MNIFVEGVPGTGKTTFIQNLLQKNPQYIAHNSSHYSPIFLYNCNVLTKQEYDLLLLKFPELKEQIIANTQSSNGYFVLKYTEITNAQDSFKRLCELKNIYGGKHSKDVFIKYIMEAIKVYKNNNYVFENVLLQNIIDELILFHEVRLDELVNIFSTIAEIMTFDYFIYYVDSDNISETIKDAANSRVDQYGIKVWSNQLLKYFNKTKHSNVYPYKNIDDCINYYRIRSAFEIVILMKAFAGHYKIIKNNEFDQISLPE